MGSYPRLSKSYKTRFPFRIATTSYIYPDNILPNVQALAPYLDEIELILFESSKESLPSDADINTLSVIGQEETLTYNVHLPLDCYLGDIDQQVRENAVATIQKIIDLTRPLSPSTYTMHLPLKREWGNTATEKGRWQERAGQGIERILTAGINPKTISVENLLYPFEWAGELISAYGLSVCLDTGHLMVTGHDIAGYAQLYHGCISIIHLYGIEKAHEHKGLHVLGPNERDAVKALLKGFNKVVSLEVFSFHDLATSLACLERWV
jgi:sugar phosphate isomerase/epimerase